jgi:aminomethyltransferase
MTSLLKTPLFDLHVSLGAKMVPFAGYDMPVQYPLGVLKEHLHVREKAGLFDVSHMGQVSLKGQGVVEFLEHLLPTDVSMLKVDHQKYSMLLNDDGRIIDDLMLVNRGEDYLLVVNAGRKAIDIAHIKENLPAGISLTVLDDFALLALQGPESVAILAELNPAVSDLKFMQGGFFKLDGTACYVTRSGYTGEDGFEISVPAQGAVALASTLLANDCVEAIGLGARDSLRLEAGLCLYGNDIDESKTPLDADLRWAISPSRRPDGAKAGGYIGSEALALQFQSGVINKRVGLKVNSRVPVRAGADVQNAAGDIVGCVSSGGFSPSLSAPVAMAYVSTDALDQELVAVVRNKPVPVAVVKLPFVTQRYAK